MTSARQKAVSMIETLSDENVSFVVKIMESLSAKPDAESISRRRKASADLQRFRGRLRADFDYKKELAEWRNERYGGSH